MRKLILSIFVLLPLIGLEAAYAQKAKTSVPATVATIKEATLRRTMPGRKEAALKIEYRFVMVWNSSVSPTSMYWRPDSKSWMTVSIARPERKPLFPGSTDYQMLEKIIDPEDVRKGDQIIVTTRHVHGDHFMPVTVKKMPAQSLYYQSKTPGWKFIKVASVRKLPDVVLP